MKVLLLAAGRSKRMKPIEDKNFLSFIGKPLIQHQLELIKSAGLKDVVVVGGAHNLGKIQSLGKGLGMNIEICEQEDLELGMSGAVMSAKEYISSAPVLIFSSNDVVEEKAFQLVLDAFKNSDSESYILGKKVESYFPGGYLETDKYGYIHNIVEKPEPGTEPSDLINLVVHLHSDPKKLIEYLEKAETSSDDIYEVALANMMKDGVKMKAVSYDGFWQPVKFPWHVMKVFKFLFDKSPKSIADTAKISDNAIINGEVIIGENVKVFDGAVINGPVYIGGNSVVATNALVRESDVSEDCVIGFSTEVARSFLGNNVWTHSNYIGDSIIGNNVSFGAGAVTGNLRLDEKNVMVDYDGNKYDSQTNKFGAVIGNNVRIGVNTSIMPGIKIGSGSFVGAGIVVPKNIDNNSYVRASWELKISENKEDIAGTDREEFKKNLS